MLSIPHLIIIFVVALVVFGPEKLPELARNLGKILGEFRRATGDLRSTFEGHLQDLEREASQRRIEGAAPTAVASPPPEAPQGTIATNPPNIPVAPPDPIDPDALEPEHRQANQQETKNENVSDGSARPA